uniref:RNase H type-1 domain-containing protein n=1 Tax=Chenopodium quinoa TaxID=63459 RepID=A0A803MM57_CHEQI
MLASGKGWIKGLLKSIPTVLGKVKEWREAGSIIRDDNGAWMIGKAWKTKSRNPAEAELLAIRGGMQMAIDANFNQVIIETNASSLKRTIQDARKYEMSELVTILKDMEAFLTKGCYFEFNYVPRGANGVAHILTKIVVDKEAIDGMGKLFDNPPCIHQGCL